MGCSASVPGAVDEVEVEKDGESLPAVPLPLTSYDTARLVRALSWGSCEVAGKTTVHQPRQDVIQLDGS
eukprot:scaffold32342_cov18-Prasinocladus_malaysianus.AAC.1